MKIQLFITIGTIALIGAACSPQGKQPQDKVSSEAVVREQAVAEPETTAPDFSPEQSGTSTRNRELAADHERFVAPISLSRERITKKPFGIRVTPETSPLEPERFSGYHTGVDYETFEDEQNTDVPIYAICGGELLQKHTASGYGGVLVQACKRNGEDIRVIYGHIALGSVAHTIRDFIAAGEQIGLLGEAGQDTDEERKHLHLGVHGGTRVDFAGYVAKEEKLSAWMDLGL